MKSSHAQALWQRLLKAINKNEHLASSFLPRERGHVLTTAKRPVGRPRKRKPSAETPPVPNINRTSEILRISDDVGQEAKWIRCQYTTKQKMHVIMRADRTCLVRTCTAYMYCVHAVSPFMYEKLCSFGIIVFYRN